MDNDRSDLCSILQDHMTASGQWINGTGLCMCLLYLDKRTVSQRTIYSYNILLTIDSAGILLSIASAKLRSDCPGMGSGRVAAFFIL